MFIYFLYNSKIITNKMATYRGKRLSVIEAQITSCMKVKDKTIYTLYLPENSQYFSKYNANGEEQAIDFLLFNRRLIMEILHEL